jgi:hypothetical protein
MDLQPYVKQAGPYPVTFLKCPFYCVPVDLNAPRAGVPNWTPETLKQLAVVEMERRLHERAAEKARAPKDNQILSWTTLKPIRSRMNRSLSFMSAFSEWRHMSLIGAWTFRGQRFPSCGSF